MKFSFVVPVYKKSAATLKRCLKSLLTQSYKDTEVIVVFDGFDEELVNVVLDLGGNALVDPKAGPLKFLVEEHGGACKARNAGAAWALGDFISFWDADCFAEPNMCNAWVAYLTGDPTLDFVYSGYKWADRPDLAGYDSEPFDPWTLEKYNYIASMFPLRKEKVLQWDESLDGLQDWDFWRRVVKSGCKGEYMPTGGVAYPFSTELPTADSISGPKADVPARIAKVRSKHGDLDKDTLVLSNLHHVNAIEVAKILDADYFPGPSFDYWHTREYKTLVQVGFDGRQLASTYYFLTAKDAKKIIYWMGPDADALQMAPFKVVNELKEQLTTSGISHYCDDQTTKNQLANINIDSSIIRFPVRFNMFSAPLPEKFKVLAYCDETYKPLIESIKKSMPDVDIDMVQPGVQYKLADYSVNLQFTEDKRLITPTRNMLLAGRYVVSNIQEPYCGYVSIEQDIDDFKRDVIKKIRTLMTVKEPDIKAQAHYRHLTAPETFIAELMKVGEEVNV